MKKILCLAVGLLALNLTPVFGQQPGTPRAPVSPPANPNFQDRLQMIVSSAGAPSEAPALTKFTLDFPGGTPADLVKAIERAMGKPLNSIIPIEDVDIQLPPLKMNDVTTPQLFAALKAASQKSVAFQTSSGGFGNSASYTTYGTSYGFNTSDSPVTDTSIWYFRADKPSLPPVVSTEKICRFFNLDPYLNRGFTVDDITTAIQTGWKMAGVSPAPELNYHKETKMLIAFGEPNKLETIGNVLNTLPGGSGTYVDIRNLNNSLGNLQSDMKKLQQKVDQLSKANPAAGAAPEEKSGK